MLLRNFRRGALGALALSLVPLVAGCDLGAFTVVIPDFESAQVQGLQMWRSDPSGTVEALEIDLGNPYVQNGGEYVDYTVTTASTVLLQGQAALNRDASNPDQVTLSFFVLDPLVGDQEYFVRSFNALGLSDFSSNSLVL